MLTVFIAICALISGIMQLINDLIIIGAFYLILRYYEKE